MLLFSGSIQTKAELYWLQGACAVISAFQNFALLTDLVLSAIFAIPLPLFFLQNTCFVYAAFSGYCLCHCGSKWWNIQDRRRGSCEEIWRNTSHVCLLPKVSSKLTIRMLLRTAWPSLQEFRFFICAKWSNDSLHWWITLVRFIDWLSSDAI